MRIISKYQQYSLKSLILVLFFKQPANLNGGPCRQVKESEEVQIEAEVINGRKRVIATSEEEIENNDEDHEEDPRSVQVKVRENDSAIKACQACVNSQLLGIFFKTNVTQSVAELVLL